MSGCTRDGRSHLFYRCYSTRRRRVDFVSMVLLVLVVNVWNDSPLLGGGKHIADATFYQPNWQQYYPHRTWTPYSEQSHGRPSRLRVGQGRYRLMPVGAQLICDFPDTMMLMISNIVWERADMGHGNDLDELYRDHGIQHDYILMTRPQGSTLQLLDVTPLDRGLYRCIATALDSHSGNTVTLFQDVHFYPVF